MRFSRWLYLLTFFLLPQSYLSAQGNADIKFGKITIGEFNLSGDTFDFSANAVVISDFGSACFERRDLVCFGTIYMCNKKRGGELVTFKKKSKS